LDVFAPEKRREIMRRIRPRGTKPELEIMGILDSLGVKYEYQAELFGHRVDFLIPDRKIVIEYRSCFWHLCFNPVSPNIYREFGEYINIFI